MTGGDADGFAVLRDDAPIERLLEAVRNAAVVVIHGSATEPTRSVIARLVATAALPGVASASPVPVASRSTPTVYPVHQCSPSPPALAIPCKTLCAINAAALASVSGFDGARGSVGDNLVAIGERQLHHGWRHVAAPGTALAWHPADAEGIVETGGWNATCIASLVGPANACLEAHVSWASSQLDGVTVVVDGACLTDDPFTGTQHVVVQIARALARLRPQQRVQLAVHRGQMSSVTAKVADCPVTVVDRSRVTAADVVYRPYQMLYAGELPFMTSTGRRGLISQLDMIGFSNPSYHPSEQLFFFARNLQRHLMRVLDGVTFISEFGRASALAECPDLETDRLHVVSCGADPSPLEGSLPDDQRALLSSGFILCLSSTFWHKNRTHAIETFVRLVEDHDYGGSLVIGGPEPYFGRSLDAEQEVTASLSAELSGRVHLWGHVDDPAKWWLLRNADLVLYPSIVEGFGLVPFEAAAVGRPSLAHAGSAPGELLAGTEALIESWDPAEWAARTADLIGNDASARALVGEVAAVAAQHTWDRCGELTWKAIDHALASPRRALHADDGSRLARVAPTPTARRLAATRVRFDSARLIPALRRRLGAQIDRFGS